VRLAGRVMFDCLNQTNASRVQQPRSPWLNNRMGRSLSHQLCIRVGRRARRANKDYSVFNLVAHALCGRSLWSGQVPVRASALTRCASISWLSITANSPWHFTVSAVSKLFTSLLMLNRESCSRNSVLINSVFFLLVVAVTLLGDRSPSSVHFYAHAKTVC